MVQFAYKSHNIDVIHTLDEKPEQKNYVIHTHITYQLCYLLSGGCTYHVEGTEYPMKPGDLIVTFPQEVHYIEVAPDTPYEKVSLNFGPAFFRTLDPDNVLHPPFINREAGHINHYRAELFPDLDFRGHIQAMLRNENDRFNIMVHLIRLLQDLRTAYDRTAYWDSQKDTLENRIIRYINSHLRRDLSLDVLCEKFFISKATLYRRFKKATGTTVSKYVETKRMLSARQMILDKENPTRICTECGFQDYSTFYRAYVRYFGHSPKEERHTGAEKT